MSRDTECFSMYSDMSKRSIFDSLSKSSWAKALAISVFPTPVGPGKRKEPMGLVLLFSCAALISTALATASAASSCPRTLAFSAGPSPNSRSRSVCESLCTGMPVHLATTCATLSAVTTSASTERPCAFSASKERMRFCSPGMASYLRSETVSTSPRISASCILLRSAWSFCFASCSSVSRERSRSYCALRGCSFSSSSANSFRASLARSAEALSFSFARALTSTSSSMRFRSMRSSSSGCEASCTRMPAQASSTRSTALSGRNRVVMYLSDSVAAATRAASWISTPWWAA
mmetsp:Transcript_76619/g.212067  ORF Transcript_76619/g.212067 Transcript_76619/m.212067 type:complete len:291 (+) Transcript_76619:1155-2027(+)